MSHESLSPEPARHSDHRATLFQNYAARIDRLDPARPDKVAWFKSYIAENYVSGLRGFGSEASILDVGCSRGYLLEALALLDYKHLHGVDLSPGDIEVAQRSFPAGDFVCEDAFSFLTRNGSAFDVIALRAVLEHTPKAEVMPLLGAIAAALRPGGLAIVDVPNMDWLFAGHERYMDFTHEVGFTQESLEQVLAVSFVDIEIRAVDHLTEFDRQTWRTRLGRRVLGTILRWADPQGAANPVFARNLVAFARRERAPRHSPG